MLPTAYVIKNSTSVDYKQTTANFRRLYIIRYRPLESNLSATNPNLLTCKEGIFALSCFVNDEKEKEA